MRRTDREIRSRSEMDAIIRGCRVCRIAMSVGEMPYIVPVSFGYDGEAVYLHTAVEGRKVSCFAANRNVCVEFERNVQLVADASSACDWSFSYESVIGFGTIRELESAEEKGNGLKIIMSQYSDREWDMGKVKPGNVRVWKVVIDSLTGKRSQRGESMFGSRSGGGYQEMIRGVRVKALTHGERTLMAEFLLSGGSEIPEHSHEHEQSGYLVRGKIRLHVESKSKEMNPGDSWLVPANVGHKVDVLEDSVAVEVFSPCREDYLIYVHQADVAD